MATWYRYNLQTRYKMKTRFYTCSIEFKFCQMCWSDKGITWITSSWLSIDLCSIPSSDREWGLYFAYQITHALFYTTNFAGYVRVTKKLHHWGHYGTWRNFKSRAFSTTCFFIFHALKIFIQKWHLIPRPSSGRSPLSSIGRSWLSGSSRNILTSDDFNASLMVEIVTDFKLVTFALFFMYRIVK